jgi:hypothetical protein
MTASIRALRAVLVCVAACGAPAAVIAATAPSAGAAYFGCDTSISNSTLVPGQKFTVAADGDCFHSDSPVDVGIKDPPAVLGDSTSSSSGSLNASVAVPAGFPLGQHTVTMTGPNALGSSVTYSLPVTIVSSVTTSAKTSGSLPFTGSDEGILIGIGAALMALGVGLTAATRRHRRPHPIS